MLPQHGEELHYPDTQSTVGRVNTVGASLKTAATEREGLNG